MPNSPFVSTSFPLQADADFKAELEAIAAESIGWLPLESGAYLHVGKEDDLTIEVVGVPEASMAGLNVLLLG